MNTAAVPVFFPSLITHVQNTSIFFTELQRRSTAHVILFLSTKMRDHVQSAESRKRHRARISNLNEGSIAFNFGSKSASKYITLAL